MGLGVPFNIASYALLTRIIAHACDMDACDFIHTMGDAHVYNDHVEALKVQITRPPVAFPKLTINTANRDIDGFKIEDFVIEGYQPHGPLSMNMSV